jgi:predicted ester cyclase
MRITVDCTPEEAEKFPELLGFETSLNDLAKLAENAKKVKRNKEVLHGFQTEVFNGNDWSIETLKKYLKEDIVDHNAFPGDLPGLEGVRSRFSYWAEAFSDAIEENIAVAGEGDVLAVLYNLHSNHTGEYIGIPPTGKSVIIPGIEFLRFEDGKIAEHWGIYDFFSTAEEIGANLTFTPRNEGAARRPEIPWGGQLPESDEASEYSN